MITHTTSLDLVQAEEEHIAEFGSPRVFSPGTCPGDYKYLHYGLCAKTVQSSVSRVLFLCTIPLQGKLFGQDITIT